MADAIIIFFYSIANITHLEILGQLLRNSLNCNVNLNQFAFGSYLVIEFNLWKSYLEIKYIASVLIEWGWSHYSRVQGEGVGTEQKLCLTSTSEWKVIFWIEIYHGSLNINRECLNSGEYIGRGWSQTLFYLFMIKCQDNIFFMKRTVCQVSRGFSGSLSENKTNPLHIKRKKINSLDGMCNATFDFGVYICGRERIIRS